MTVATGMLSDNGGRIGTNGAASVRADSLSNRGGALSAQGAMSVIVSGATGIDNSASGYIGGQSLDLSAVLGQINNANGLIEAATGAAYLRSQSLVNDYGTIRALGNAS